MLVFDVGGTFIKYAIFDKDNNIVLKDKVSTPNGMQIVSLLYGIYNKYNSEYNFVNIGISTAGQVDHILGKIVYAAPTIPDYTGVKLKEELESLTKCNVYVQNDVTSCMFNFQDCSNMLYIAIGTGIGGAFKYNGEIYYGDNNRSLEIGQMYHPAGDKFEAICSTKSLLENYYLITKKRINGEDLDQLWLSQDEVAHDVINDFLINIAIGIANIAHILDCNNVTIGGGVTEAKFFDVEKIQNKLNESTSISDTIKVTKSVYFNDAPLYGMNKWIRGEQCNI